MEIKCISSPCKETAKKEAPLLLGKLVDADRLVCNCHEDQLTWVIAYITGTQLCEKAERILKGGWALPFCMLFTSITGH